MTAYDGRCAPKESRQSRIVGSALLHVENGGAKLLRRLFLVSMRWRWLELVPEELVVDFVVILDFWDFHEGAEEARAAVGGGLF
jgi:hypothetical protein